MNMNLMEVKGDIIIGMQTFEEILCRVTLNEVIIADIVTNTIRNCISEKICICENVHLSN